MLNRLGQAVGLAGMAMFAMSTPAIAMEAEGLAVEESDEHGEYLVTSEGRSVYMFESDEEDESICYDDCADAWPPLTPENGTPVAGEGVDEDMIGTIEREDGTEQVTYDGQPLYLFVRDTMEGDTTGHEVEGFGDEWKLVSPEGGAVATADHSDAVGSEEPPVDEETRGSDRSGVAGDDDVDSDAGDDGGSTTDGDSNGDGDGNTDGDGYGS